MRRGIRRFWTRVPIPETCLLKNRPLNLAAAMTKDPNYAQAYAGSADAHALLGSMPTAKMPRETAMPKAKEMALTD